MKESYRVGMVVVHTLVQLLRRLGRRIESLGQPGHTLKCNSPQAFHLSNTWVQLVLFCSIDMQVIRIYLMILSSL